MTFQNAKTPRVVAGASQEVHGGTDPTVAQVRRRREAASRCEPLECGHRDPLDCDAEACGEQPDEQSASPDPEPTVDPFDFVKLWADAKALFFTGDFPEYGSQAWRGLGPDDPARLAAALDAAEKWRKYGDDATYWLEEASRPRPPVWQRPTYAEREQAWQDMLARNGPEWTQRRAATDKQQPEAA
ncbi:hypothetical protein [Streptomyces coffeae]|uniref:DUF2742 domain-containing protein n=1 Tax=Streptomyces coffeae TaxID=621382 RepID=A0ABS1NG62_9ACTN|nr:hypothetical protein [Streptomyces coffeae]MBL1098917.1 hypothetical protein [Streptomyces coffeae]